MNALSAQKVGDNHRFVWDGCRTLLTPSHYVEGDILLILNVRKLLTLFISQNVFRIIFYTGVLAYTVGFE